MFCWYLYVIKTVDGFLYTGISTDVGRRFREHLAQGGRTAKFLRIHKPLAVAFTQAIGDRSLALKVENRFKLLSRKEKERIIKAQCLIFDSASGCIGMTRRRAKTPMCF